MAKTDKDILIENLYKHEHGNTPVIKGGAYNYPIQVRNNYIAANRALHGSTVAIRHTIDPKNRSFF
tara:strand:+ start:748 stop:945 length:198 start_codon:yes stop_codon:yes gene_type:complete